MESEVLIYLNKLRKYFETNREAKEYFLEGLDKEVFMEKVSEFAEKNFMDKGDPALSMGQFEFIRKVLLEDTIQIKVDTYIEPNIFIDKRGLVKIIKK